jgi:ketosteroid isomerase-like protein
MKLPANLLCLAFCAPLLFAACSRPAATPETEAARLLQADRDFAAASVRDGAAPAFFSAMTSDAIGLPPDGAVQNRDKISSGLQGMGTQVLDWTPQHAEVARSLDLGWTWGEWRLSDTSTSGRLLSHGKYLNIWKRQPSGTWKLAVDIGNEAAPNPAADAPPKPAPAPAAAVPDPQ